MIGAAEVKEEVSFSGSVSYVGLNTDGSEVRNFSAMPPYSVTKPRDVAPKGIN